MIDGKLRKFFSLFGVESPIIVTEYKTNQRITINDALLINDKCITWIPNGDIKSDNIKYCSTWFADFDSGKRDGKYLPLDEVATIKQKLMLRIKDSPLKPTAVVETRNGYHVYWRCKDPCESETWKSIQELLILFFDSDPVIKTPNRQMRVPYTYWCKHGYDKYFCNLIETNDVGYSIDDMTKCFNVTKGRKQEQKEKKSSFVPPITPDDEQEYEEYLSQSHYYIIRDGNIDGLQALLEPEAKEFECYQDFYDYITQEIDLDVFLGINLNNPFSCIFHHDAKPSATLFRSKYNQYLYHCFSENWSGNIVACVEKIRRLGRQDAVDFIKQVYKLDYMESEWQIQQKRIIDENIRILQQELEDRCKDTNIMLGMSKAQLIQLLICGKDHIRDETFTDNDANPVFFSSLRYIAKCMGYKSLDRLCKNINLFCVLGLIKKPPPDEIPKSDLDRAIKYAAKNGRDRLPTFYSIIGYSEQHLEKVRHDTKLLKQSSFTKYGMSWEYICRTFGKEKADEIFPQDTKLKISKKSNTEYGEIQALIQQSIETSGYAIEKKIVERMGGYEKNQVKLKRCIGQMLKDNGWKKIKTNKELKEQYNISSQGYPYIIVKN